jgi:hypothetical protein
MFEWIALIVLVSAVALFVTLADEITPELPFSPLGTSQTTSTSPEVAPSRIFDLVR